MRIQYYIPAKLRGLVQMIWEQQSETPTRWQILPSGKVELIFNIGPKMEDIDGKRIGGDFNPTERFCFLSGLHTKPLYMSFSRFHVMGIQMQPIAVKAFFGIPCIEVRDWAIWGEYILNEINKIEDQLRGKGSFMQKAKCLEKFLFSKVNENSELYIAFKLNDIVNKFSGSTEVIKIGDLTGYSRTHTHRLFTEWLGLSATHCLRLQQFLRALEQIHYTPEKLTDIAFQNGYYDQAHFIRHFREFANMTPGAYKRQKTDLIGQLSA